MHLLWRGEWVEGNLSWNEDEFSQDNLRDSNRPRGSRFRQVNYIITLKMGTAFQQIANKSMHFWISGMFCNWFGHCLITDCIFFQGPWHQWWHFSTSAISVNATLICVHSPQKHSLGFTSSRLLLLLLTSTHTTAAYSSAFFSICLFVYLLLLWDILQNLCTAFLLCPTLGQGPCGLGTGGSGLGGMGVVCGWRGSMKLQIASHDSWLFVFLFCFFFPVTVAVPDSKHMLDLK